ncbi:hypothetical protein HOT31_gp120 [Microbacterium phage Hendrix]|uniref:Uncharacterized protein n=1 Tax=Microbacterium phage Hendrix TaxID=2182341 RepID=A0A4P8W176_9CAUD|nr:hypothetical protein HOT31_gp120 [Microbacterium phage Hendrix]QCS26948.1 hypothetical protein PBI_Hendrix_159 [Microbacterium phage Hendrix]
MGQRRECPSPATAARTDARSRSRSQSHRSGVVAAMNRRIIDRGTVSMSDCRRA